MILLLGSYRQIKRLDRRHLLCLDISSSSNRRFLNSKHIFICENINNNYSNLVKALNHLQVQFFIGLFLNQVTYQVW